MNYNQNNIIFKRLKNIKIPYSKKSKSISRIGGLSIGIKQIVYNLDFYLIQ